MKAMILLPAMLMMVTPCGAQAQAVGAQADDPLMTSYRDKTRVIRTCDRSGNAIVVCGSRAERNARERLPLPRERAEGTVRGDASRASAAPVRQGSCGVVGGQGGGCVGGLNVFGVASGVARAITAIVDPDADLAPPPPLPDRAKGTGLR